MSSTRHIREVAEFVERLMASTKPDTAAGKKLGAWLREHESLLGLPNAVPPGPFVHISAGVYDFCGVRPDGTVSCWGQISRTP